MKQIELNLQKRLLIVEAEPEFEPKQGVEYYVPDDAEDLFILPKGKFKLICKGSEITEEIASELVPQKMNVFIPQFWNYKDHEDLFHATKSFISAIEVQGYYWGENPIDFNDDETDFGKRHEMRVNWEIAESKTFNPEKTLIFEILL